MVVGGECLVITGWLIVMDEAGLCSHLLGGSRSSASAPAARSRLKLEVQVRSATHGRTFVAPQDDPGRSSGLFQVVSLKNVEDS